jgi:hypothetical protein
MQLIDDEILTWDDIKANTQDEWVIIANPIFDGMKLIERNCVGSSPRYKRCVASIEGGVKVLRIYCIIY